MKFLKNKENTQNFEAQKIQNYKKKQLNFNIFKNVNY